MIEWLLHNWEGYVRLRLHGYSPERFLNLCNARRLEVWGLICNRDGDYEFYMTVKGYRRVKPLVRAKRRSGCVSSAASVFLFLFINTGNAGIMQPDWELFSYCCMV